MYREIQKSKPIFENTFHDQRVSFDQKIPGAVLRLFSLSFRSWEMSNYMWSSFDCGYGEHKPAFMNWYIMYNVQLNIISNYIPISIGLRCCVRHPVTIPCRRQFEASIGWPSFWGLKSSPYQPCNILILFVLKRLGRTSMHKKDSVTSRTSSWRSRMVITRTGPLLLIFTRSTPEPGLTRSRRTISDPSGTVAVCSWETMPIEPEKSNYCYTNEYIMIHRTNLISDCNT